MFKILTYKQLFESKEFYWKAIYLPNIYPSKNLSEEWIETHEDSILGKKVKCFVLQWDRRTQDFEADLIEMNVKDIYSEDGFIYFVDENNRPNKILRDSIEVWIEEKRLFSKEDPYGEENWD